MLALQLDPRSPRHPRPSVYSCTQSLPCCWLFLRHPEPESVTVSATVTAVCSAYDKKRIQAS